MRSICVCVCVCEPAFLFFGCFYETEISVFFSLFLCRVWFTNANDHSLTNVNKTHNQTRRGDEKKNMNVKCKLSFFFRQKYAYNKLKVLQHWVKINVKTLRYVGMGMCIQYTHVFFWFISNKFPNVCCVLVERIYSINSGFVWIRRWFYGFYKIYERGKFLDPATFILHSIVCYLAAVISELFIIVCVRMKWSMWAMSISFL